MAVVLSYRGRACQQAIGGREILPGLASVLQCAEAMKDKALREAIERIGGVRAMARALGIAHPTVLQWDHAPARWVLSIERLSGIMRHELRPDLYPPADRHGY